MTRFHIITAMASIFCIAAGNTSVARDNIPAPSDSMPSEWLYYKGETSPLPSDDRWWKRFNDPVLDTLVNMAERRNYNLASAARRIEVSRNQLRQTRSSYYPSLAVQGGWNLSKGSGRTARPYSSPDHNSYFGLQGNLSWEIDLFGRIAAQAKADKSDIRASRAEYASAMVSLCAEVASDYFQLITFKQQLRVALQHITTQQEIVKMTEARYKAGLVSALDVAQARTVVISTQEAVPGLRANIANLRRSIATLCGVYEHDLPPVTAPDTLPDRPSVSTFGIPADLLRRRPDIVAEEARLASLAAQIGVARKDFLPTLTLNGSFGVEGHNLGEMWHKDGVTYSVAPTLTWTVFDGLARNYRVADAKLQFEIALDSYNLTVMTAVEDVNNAMSDIISLDEQTEIDRKVIVESRETLRLALERYKLGLADFSNVVNAQVALLQYENNLVATKGNSFQALVNLYRALGGGWTDSTNLE